MNLRPRYVIPALLVICIATAFLIWQRKIQSAKAAEVAPYTAHLTIAENRLLADGTSFNTVSTEILARDRQGRTVEERQGSFFVQDPVKQQTLSWGSKSQVAILVQWPYWAGRKGCWADENGQIRSTFPTDKDWHQTPASPAGAKVETIGSFADEPNNEQIKTRFVTENLGQKEIHGLIAFGMRSTRTPLEDGGPNALPETTTELWKSSELNLKLLELTSGPKYGLERRELTDLQRGEPDPALFEPPLNYKVQTVTYHQVACGQY